MKELHTLAILCLLILLNVSCSGSDSENEPELPNPEEPTYITGINAMYELQFRTVSAQMATIDQINEENRKMVKRIEELNAVYTRMLEAMTTNMNMNLKA